MAQRLKLAMNWAGACGGCDVSLLDIEEKLLELLDVAELVFWPVAMDFKRTDLAAWGAGEIDVGIFNGVIRWYWRRRQRQLLRVLEQLDRKLDTLEAQIEFVGLPRARNRNWTP